MSTIRNPVGPQPPSVYWRRRLVLLLGLIAVIVVIVLIIVRPGGTPSSSPSSSPSASTPVGDPSSTPSPTFTSAEGGTACNPAQVTVVSVTDSNSYAAGVKPMISMKITNAGSAPCTFDVGTGAQEYIITSGTDRIWSSKDCQKSPTSTPQVLQPGVELTTTPFAWDRTRSSTTTCDSTRPAAVSNSSGPTYKLQVKLGGVESQNVSFRLF
ncbi:MAG TPA: hypothetical protein VGO65_12425 [Pseudolysinimonas sp.]|nr:hypothetical protein [Pseudolysinimonas sp.]